MADSLGAHDGRTHGPSRRRRHRRAGQRAARPTAVRGPDAQGERGPQVVEGVDVPADAGSIVGQHQFPAPRSRCRAREAPPKAGANARPGARRVAGSCRCRRRPGGRRRAPRRRRPARGPVRRAAARADRPTAPPTAASGAQPPSRARAVDQRRVQPGVRRVGHDHGRRAPRARRRGDGSSVTTTTSRTAAQRSAAAPCRSRRPARGACAVRARRPRTAGSWPGPAA